MPDLTAVTQIEITARDSTATAFDSVRKSLATLEGGVASLEHTFQGLLSAVSVGAFTHVIAGAIESVAAFHDLAVASGATVEGLSKMEPAARAAGVSMQEVATMTARIGKSMTDAVAGTGKAAEVFKTLGYSTQDLARMLKGDAAIAIEDVAKRMADFENSMGKAAAQMILTGRGGAQTAKFFSELAEQTDRVSTVTAAQVQQAKQLEDAWSRMRSQWDAVTRASVMGLVPALLDIAKAFADILNNRDANVGFFTALGTALKLVAVDAMGAWTALTIVGKAIGFLAAAGEISRNAGGGKAGLAAIKEQFKELTLDIDSSMVSLRKFIETVNLAGSKPLTFKPTKPGKTFNGPTDAETTKAQSEYLHFLEQMRQQAAVAQDQLEHTFDVNPITEAEKAFDKFAASDAWAKLSANQKAAAYNAMLIPAAIQQQDAELKKLMKDFEAFDKATAVWEREKEAIDMAKHSIDDIVQRAQDYADTAGLSAEAQRDANGVREIGNRQLILENDLKRAGIENAHDLAVAYGDEAKAALLANNARADAVKNWHAVLADAAQGVQNFIVDFAENGTKAFRNLWDNFKHWALEALAEIAAKQIVVSIVGALGVGGASGAAASGGLGASGSSLFNLLSTGSSVSGMLGGPSLGSGVSSMLGLTGAAGGAFGAAAGAGFSAGAATLGIAAEAGAAAVGGTAAVLGAMAAMVPVVGAVVAIGYLLYQALSQAKGGPKAGGFAASGGLAGLNVDSNLRYYTPNQNDPAMLAVVDTINKTYTTTLAALGGKAGAAVAFGLGYDTDPLGKANNRVSAGASIGGRSVYDARNIDVGRDDTTLQAMLKTQAARALLAALQASDLPVSVAKIINSVPAMTASDDAITAILTLGQAWGTLAGDLENKPLADMLAAIGDAASNSFAGLTNAATALRTLMDAFDGSADAVSALTTATNNYKIAQYQLLAQLEQVRTALNQTFADTVRSLQLQVLDSGGQYDFYTKEASALYQQVATTTDPAAIQKLGDKINADLQAAFGLLDPTAQKSKLQEYLTNIGLITTAVNERLTAVETDVHQSVSDTLAEVSGKLDSAADKFVSAADINLEAAQTPLVVEVTVPPMADVTGGG